MQADFLELVLPRLPFGLVPHFLENQNNPNPKSLLLNAFDALIDGCFDDETKRAIIIAYFSEGPLDDLRCKPLQKWTNLFCEILEKQMRNGLINVVSIGIWKNKFHLAVSNEILLEIESADEYPTHLARQFFQTSFRGNVHFIKFTLSGEGELTEDEMAEKTETFISSFNVIRVPRGQHWYPPAGRMIYHRNNFRMATSHLTIFDARSHSTGQSYCWGYVE